MKIAAFTGSLKHHQYFIIYIMLNLNVEFIETLYSNSDANFYGARAGFTLQSFACLFLSSSINSIFNCRQKDFRCNPWRLNLLYQILGLV